jgi:T-complex protein 1 subunit alpha
LVDNENSETEVFAKLAVDAVSATRTVKMEGKVEKVKYPIKGITILKAHGRSIRESELVNGYALNCQRASTAMPAIVHKAKIALLG